MVFAREMTMTRISQQPLRSESSIDPLVCRNRASQIRSDYLLFLSYRLLRLLGKRSRYEVDAALQVQNERRLVGSCL